MTNEEAIFQLNKIIKHFFSMADIEERLALNMAIEALKLILDNATNGDIVKILFPDAGLSNLEAGHVLIRFGNGCSIRVDLDWWNAPYKRGDEEC